MPDLVHIVGRFPPPIDGQTMATERLANLLASVYEVRRFSTSIASPQHVQAEVRLRLERVRHYLGQRRHLREALADASAAPVLWASISPAPLGHLRDWTTVLPAIQPGQPVLAVIHRGNFDDVFQHPLTAASARRMVAHVHRFVFLTEHLATACAAWIPPEQRAVVPNTIDEAVLCTNDEVAAKQARRQGREGLRLLFLSNMIPSKGYLDVLQAAHLLHQQGFPFHIDYVGGWTSDADRTAFEQFVKQEGLEAVVTHHGSLADRAHIKTLYLETDLFLLPTYYPTEAQPLTILEALNAGTPVIATSHAGIPEMVRDGTEAVLVPPRAPRAIADAVHRLADAETWHHFSTQARHRFLTHFSPDAVRRHWLDLLADT